MSDHSFQQEIQHPASESESFRRRGIKLRGRSVRQHAARGTIINSVFSISVALITLIRGMVIARFLTRADYGIWGIIIASLGMLFTLKQIGIGDKYIQQDEGDEELAYQKAFSNECVISAAFLVLLLIAVPIAAAVYRRPELILPGFSMALLLPANALQSATWIFYRQMRFGRLRLLQAIDPVLGSVTALSLAVAGAGYWSLMAGVVAGAWGTALASLRASPYRLRFRFDLGSLRSYLSFSWPLFVTAVSSLVLVQAALFFGTAVTGVAGAGAITLSSTVSQFAERVDEIVSGTMYPVVCAVQNRRDLLYESFVKSNRVALLWAVPFGVGLSFFASDLVHYGIGEKWRPAVPILVAFGVTAAAGHLAFNWDDYFRARGETRPIAWAMFLTAVSFLLVGIPLIYLWGLKGFAAGVGVQVIVHLICRVFFLRRLFGGFDMLRHAARAVAPTIPPALVLGVMRVLEPGRRTLGLVIAELVLYGGLTVATTWLLERKLILEMLSYLRRSPSPQPSAGQDHRITEPGLPTGPGFEQAGLP